MVHGRINPSHLQPFLTQNQRESLRWWKEETTDVWKQWVHEGGWWAGHWERLQHNWIKGNNSVRRPSVSPLWASPPTTSLKWNLVQGKTESQKKTKASVFNNHLCLLVHLLLKSMSSKLVKIFSMLSLPLFSLQI